MEHERRPARNNNVTERETLRTTTKQTEKTIGKTKLDWSVFSLGWKQLLYLGGVERAGI
jgi:hypothetical protein